MMEGGSLRYRRYREIAEALTRHGLGYLAGTLGLDRFVPFHRGLLGHPRRETPYTRPEHVRMALGDLGTTFVKLGQILSTRGDLLPPDYQVELARLQDAAPPVPAEAVREALVTELGRPIEAVFATFDPEPLAAASIGQAHAATLPDGTEVVVKVRRPGVVEQVQVDLEILEGLAAAAARRWPPAESYDVVGLAQEFAQTLRGELDYLREARNAERFAADFAGDPGVRIPRVFREASTSRVLTLERLRGIKIDDVAALDAAGVDRPALAARAARILLTMIFENGFFHADPHPGNFFVEPSGRIGLIDFGMVGTVDEPTQERLAEVLVAVTRGDAGQLADALVDLGFSRRRVERGRLARDLTYLMARYEDRPLGEVRIGPLIEEALAIVRAHRLQLPPSLAMLLKTVVMSEGVGARIDPGFRLAAALAPYAETLVVRQYSALRWARRLGQASVEAARLVADLPQQIRRLVAQAERGHFEVTVRPSSFEPLLVRLERLTNRLVLGILTAAFVVGVAVVMLVYHPGGWERWMGVFFGVGFGLAALLGAYLAWTILRSGRG